MDLYTTLVKLAGQEPPKDRIVDGIDLFSALFQQKNIDRYIGFILWTSIGDNGTYPIYMGESFQDYSWIQDSEANFP